MFNTQTAVDPQLLVSILVDTLKNNYGVLMRQVNGLTHNESLLQFPFRGNCLNWVMGHIVHSRHQMLSLVDETPLWTPEQLARYKRDSEPVLGEAPDVIRFEKMLDDLKTTQEKLVARIKSYSAEELQAPGTEVIKGLSGCLADQLSFFIWHETYHVGQTDSLRQLAGRNDKVI
jgi:uncharacterized damage-inducible protein DinB